MEIGFDAGNSPAELTTHFRGIIDEVQFFDAALSAEELKEVMKGSVEESSGHDGSGQSA